MRPSTTSFMPINEGLVESQETSHMSFFSQPSPLPHPHLSFPLYGLQNSLETLAPPRVNGVVEFSSNLKDLGSSFSIQETTSTINPLSSSTREDAHNISNKSSNISTINNRSYNENLSSVGAKRMKKVMKARRKVREPRFCFKTMSEVDVLDDGYKWRKYGQKVVKNTQHPRSYYRCTQDNCRVKKRVERLAEDARMVITTYEGRHAHSPPRDEDESNQASSHINFFC
ncbi:probable WRKY transcription factor 12 [Asparagus officinalis]|uniref:probable WRKY transcription factor 12 n=1 Tax=Asparagus officinalis TaxID=4686 RepID=UPI00098E107B|nr:probable WRKY transcription factor 12 [Asparagus officinalis]